MSFTLAQRHQHKDGFRIIVFSCFGEWKGKFSLKTEDLEQLFCFFRQSRRGSGPITFVTNITIIRTIEFRRFTDQDTQTGRRSQRHEVQIIH